MSIASEITRLQNIKADIRSALVSKGITGAAAHDMADFAVDISNIQNGGGYLTVTYSEEFYGATLTASNGSKTVTKVAPSTGSVEIVLPESGTWTVSATISGETYTSKPVSVDLEYDTVLESVPNGSTVLPTDDIEIWLKCAQIKDKAYTTLGEVLADTDTFESLCADSNACDYMARSTSWANSVCGNSTAMTYIGNNNYCANKLLSDSTWASAIYNSAYVYSVCNNSVPTMTSNTTPSGTAFANEENARAYYAFDGDSATKWYSASGGTFAYIGYMLPEDVKIYGWGFAGNTDSPLLAPTEMVIQVSDDGTTYTDLQTQSSLPNDGQFHTYSLPTPTTAKYIRAKAFKRNVSGNIYAQLSRLQFYGRTPYTPSQLATIHGAANDSIYYLDNGSPVTIATTDTDGVGTVDLSSLSGTLTLYSTVAKNPTDLSADYSKVVRVNENVTEVYMMPITSLYWWGYQNNLEEMSTANGWINWGSSITFESPTYNTNNIDLKPSASNKARGVASKDKIPIDKLYGIATTGGASTYGRISTIGQKTSWSGQIDVTFANTGIAKYTLNDTDQADRYAFSINLIDTSLAVSLNALWYE